MFVRDGVVVYVGQSTALRNRLGAYWPTYRRPFVPYSDEPQHRAEWIVSALLIGAIVKISPTKRYGDWLMRELRLIRRLRPDGNLNPSKYTTALMDR